MSAASGYSEKVRNLQKNHYEQLKEFSKQQRAVIHNKTRKFSIENSRRRRAHELRKKIEAQKEIKRRQEALAERKRRQQEATVKYQRQKRTGSAAEKSRTPGLEEALNAVQISSIPHYRTKYQSNPYSPVNTVHVYSPWRPAATPNLYNSATYRAQHEQLQSTSAHNLQHSKSLFEQHLQEQQRQLAVQQQKSLQDFNHAILSESRRGHVEEAVDNSLCSVDSLDGTAIQDERGDSLQRTGNGSVPQSTNSTATTYNPPSTLTSTHVAHIPSSGSDYIATSNKAPHAQYNSVAGTFTGSTLEGPLAQPSETKLFVPKSSTLTASANIEQGNNQSIAQAKPAWKETADLYIEETNEADVVEDKLDLQKPQQTMPVTSTVSSSARYTSMYGSPGLGTYANTHLIGRTTRPFSARTSATGVTVTPAAYNWNEYNPARTTEGSVGGHATNLNDPYGTGSRLMNHTSPYNASNTSEVQRTSDYPVNGSPSQGPSTHASHQAATNGNSNAEQNSSGSERSYQKYKPASVPNKQETFSEQKRVLSFVDEAGEDDTPEDSTQDRPQGTQPKGILKKSPMNKYNTYGGAFTRSTYMQQSLEGQRLRDSIDVAKMKQDPFEDSGKKKSVRWTDWEKHSKLTQELRTPRGNGEGLGKRRPFSATTLSISKVPASVKAPRSASAGSARKSPGAKSRPGLKPQPVAATRKMATAQNGGAGKATSVSNGVAQPESGGGSDSRATVRGDVQQNGDARTRGYVYNGPPLEKTPTDEEINWLWDKVRTCLSSRESDRDVIHRRASDVPANRQVATVQKQTIDGRQFVSQLRPTTVTPNNMAESSGNGSGSTLRKVTRSNGSQSGNSYIRLLQLRKQHAKRVNSLQKFGNDAQQQTEYETIQPYATDPGLTESLQLFQTAEKLSQQPELTEADIAAALQRQHQAASTAGQPYSSKGENHDGDNNDGIAHPEARATVAENGSNSLRNKAPSALSLEEQRILQSLDRLNERLRIVTDTNLQGSSMATKPTQYTMRMHSAGADRNGVTMAASTGINRREPINKNIRRVNYRH